MNRRDTTARFWEKVQKSDGCWTWTGSKTRAGYGRIMVYASDGPADYTIQLAHRLSYRLAYGDFEQSLLVCHHCDTPSCIRPDHLFLGTSLDNVTDMHSKGRYIPWQRRLTHCKRGHPLSGDNIRVGNKGERICLTCNRDYQRGDYARRRAQGLHRFRGQWVKA